MEIKQAEYDWELQGILDLQASNLESALLSNDGIQDGFVTLKHDMNLLSQMNKEVPSIIAAMDQHVVAYSLCMSKNFRNDIPFLVPMFDLIDSLIFRDTPLSSVNYLIGGQVCVEKKYRGTGLFAKLYNKAKDLYTQTYPLMLTEVSDRNPRSLKAHLKCGFESIHQYSIDGSENWHILAWHWALS